MIIELAARRQFLATYDTERSVMIFFIRDKNTTLEIDIEDFMYVVSVLTALLFKRYEVKNNEIENTPEVDRIDGTSHV